MEDRLLPIQYVPPLHHADDPKGKAGLLQFGANAVAGAVRTKLKSATSCLRVSDSGLFLRIYSRSFSHEWVWLQGNGGFK